MTVIAYLTDQVRSEHLSSKRKREVLGEMDARELKCVLKLRKLSLELHEILSAREGIVNGGTFMEMEDATGVDSSISRGNHARNGMELFKIETVRGK
jgi:hypothetical protein